VADSWVVSNPPHSIMTPVDKVPVSGVDGSTMQRFTTTRGKLWLQVVLRSHRTYWLRLRPGAPSDLPTAEVPSV
jgi:hypothetical protein